MAKASKLKALIRTIVFLLVVFAAAIIMVATYDLYIISSVSISGSSMEPTIHGTSSAADSVMFWESFYTLERGDIIVFFNSENADVYPIDKCPTKKHLTFADFMNKCGDVVTDLRNMVTKIFSKDAALAEHKFKRSREGYRMLIKRIIAVEGDAVKIENGELYIKFAGTDEYVLQEEDYIYEPMFRNNRIDGKYGVNDGEWTVGDGEYFVLGDNRNVSIDSEDYGPINGEQILGKVFVIRRDGAAIRID